jgi:hypothetical protein
MEPSMESYTVYTYISYCKVSFRQLPYFDARVRLNKRVIDGAALPGIASVRWLPLIKARKLVA